MFRRALFGPVCVLMLLSGCRETQPLEFVRFESFTEHEFREEGLPVRNYYIYAPRKLPPGLTPMVVYLHGCGEHAKVGASISGWNDIAEEQQWIVVYPEQSNLAQFNADEDEPGDSNFDGNPLSCWNWFLPGNFNRGSGEPGVIAGITREVIARFPVDTDRVFIMGMSSGGMMASTMGATYPDLYAAVGAFAACNYPTCIDNTGTRAFVAMGDNAERLPVIALHGTVDSIVPFVNGVGVVQQWLGTNDWIDDGELNLSISRMPARTTHHGFTQQLPDDTCGSGSPADCPTAPDVSGDTYPHSIEYYNDAQGCPLVEFWMIHGLGHFYPSQAPGILPFKPPLPDITQAVFNFFESNPRGAQHRVELCQPAP